MSSMARGDPKEGSSQYSVVYYGMVLLDRMDIDIDADVDRSAGILPNAKVSHWVLNFCKDSWGSNLRLGFREGKLFGAALLAY